MSAQTFASIHIIGLGGAGANIIQSLIESERLLSLLSAQDSRLACLAVDVADEDLASLMASHEKTLEKLENEGISADRLWLKTVHLRVNAFNSLLEFMEKYDSYLAKEGINVKDYKPWIQPSLQIPQLTDGVGRLRALGKALYSLNYYQYAEMNNILSMFKDRVLTSKNQPIVLLVFGLGGGTGSGMIFDLCRHLRAKLGSAIPIVGLAILPSSADNVLARGPAPYAALMDAELLFNRQLNNEVTSRFGEAYRNPFSSIFFLALDPVYNSKNSLPSAKKELDEAVGDTLNVLTRFDLADLLSRVGTNNDFGANWVHSIAYLRIRYPVDDYLRYLHQYLKSSETTGAFMDAKSDLLVGIDGVIKSRYSEVLELYRKHLISINSYRAETFEKEVDELVHRAGRYEVEFRKELKGVEAIVSCYGDRWSKSFEAMPFADDTVEHALLERIRHWGGEIRQIGKTHEEFTKSLPSYKQEFESSITASKFFTSSHIRQLRSYMDLIKLVGISIMTIDSYLRAKALADELVMRYSKDQSREGRRAVTIGESELVPLEKSVGSVLTRPETEVRMVEQFMPGIRLVRRSAENRFKEHSEEAESLRRQLTRKQTEELRLSSEIEKIRLDIGGRKKSLYQSLEKVKSEEASIRSTVEEMEAKSVHLRADLDLMLGLEKSLEATGQYRKKLASVVNGFNDLKNLNSSTTSASSYYERVVELSETEQEKIMERILREEEATLKAEGILKEIVDKDRFREVVKSYVRILGIPNYAGLDNTYRSDLMWATVGIPQDLWDQELQMILLSTLNVFSIIEASKSISVRQIPQIDPWTITFLVILAKARVDQVEKFSSMKNDAQAALKTEKGMFRSFLLEHSIQDSTEFISQLGTSIQTKRHQKS